MLRMVKMFTAGMIAVVLLCGATMTALACGVGGSAGAQTSSGEPEKS